MSIYSLFFMTWMLNREVKDKKREQIPIACLQIRFL